MHFGSELHAFSLHAGALFGQLMNFLHSLETIIASGPMFHAQETIIASHTQETIIAR